ncbi:MAG: NAD(P)-dependent oxidoreductase [Methanomassiliicoccaceae archaeon]|jgi:nucleoside-diphosphate-sugar epimerase|nr:NAD(P)-dependent oxidoreductase [Methanomassiliicoccaceae archaeon]
MRIAITGATSMTGIALAKLALNEGHEVVAIVRPGSSGIADLPVSKRMSLRESDISDYGSLSGADACDIFFHLAWNKTAAGGRDDMEVQLKNLEYTLDAVRLAKSWSASAFVGVGSQAEYGILDGKAGKDTPTNPTSGYGIAKYSAGKMAAILCKQLGMRCCWARIFSSYGEYDRDYTLIMYLIRTLLSGSSPELTKCEQTWDYVYTGDVARALLAMGVRGTDGRTYPIGSGECRPLRDYVTDVRDSIDPKIELRFGVKDYYPHQQMFLCADIADLTRDTGFIPKYSFKEGIARTVSFVRDQLNRMPRKD